MLDVPTLLASAAVVAGVAARDQRKSKKVDPEQVSSQTHCSPFVTRHQAFSHTIRRRTPPTRIH